MNITSSESVDLNEQAWKAVSYGDEGCLHMLKEASCDLGQANDGLDGRTPAYNAAMDGNEGCLRLLKETGCDLKQTDNDGLTPAHMATQNGQEDCLRVLKEATSTRLEMVKDSKKDELLFCFFILYKNWIVKELLTNNNGLTILEKIDR